MSRAQQRQRPTQRLLAAAQGLRGRAAASQPAATEGLRWQLRLAAIAAASAIVGGSCLVLHWRLLRQLLQLL